MFYCATVFDPPFDMLKKHGVDITGEVAEIRQEIPNAPLSDELMSPAGACFERSAMELGYDCHRLNKLIFQRSMPSGLSALSLWLPLWRQMERPPFCE